MTAILEQPESSIEKIKVVDMQQDMISEAIKTTK